MLSNQLKILLMAICFTISISLFSACSSKSSQDKTTKTVNVDNKSNSEKTDKKVVDKSNYPSGSMNFIAPAGEGGGWDKTIRAVAKTLKDTNLVSVDINVSNAPGKGGASYLEQLQNKKGTDSDICIYSPPIILNNLSGTTPLTYKDATPISKLISDYQMFIVKKGSKFKSFNDVINSLKKNPQSVKIGGTSAAGSMDHIAFLIIAKAAGVANLKDINYTVMADIKSAQAQLDGDLVDVYSTGIADGKSLVVDGKATALAISSDKRLKADKLKDIPTCKEVGINATFENWRGLFGPPDMPDKAVEYWDTVLAKLVETPEWKTISEENGWDIKYSSSADFTKFISKKEKEFKTILEGLGMLK
jgi:putative tricarboxylic transport membrane protein